ncbi:hypothetical protein [Bradyrhizobium liaoningense]|uniref:hypothetical protein n=1 Tax=Bradyrhizobium liaoningense TaxID=43992 RepID=UPI001BACA714|nr:hypothetical protein [Bradyrhizobium liaoningense]MBR0901217.1 hypothetical protein [Bradyrhizobium liaoningense]
MVPKTSKAPHRVTTGGDPLNDLRLNAITSENNLSTVRLQYLEAVFALPADASTTALIAALAFGEVRS